MKSFASNEYLTRLYDNTWNKILWDSELSLDHSQINKEYEKLIYEILQEVENADEVSCRLSSTGNMDYVKHFSDLRCNLFSWLPYEMGDRILIVGKQVFTFAVSIGKRCKVDCISSDGIDLMMLAEIGTCEKLVYHKSLFYKGDLDKYDYIIFTDFIKVKKNNIDDSEILQFVSQYRSHLKADGTIVFSAENALGLKYWAGCIDDCTNTLWTSLEGYPVEEAGNPTLKDINDLVEKMDFHDCSKFYPYPDCWFPTSIYSDSYMPEIGELVKNAFSWEHRIHLFNEINVWNSIIKNGQFSFFSNGYVVLLSDKASASKKNIVYTKFSNDRANDYSIKTDIYIDEKGKKHVEKIGCTCAGADHVSHLTKIENELNSIYADGGLRIQKTIHKGNGIELEFIEGKSLSVELKELLEAGQGDEFIRKFSCFAQILIDKAKLDYMPSDSFYKVFGMVSVPVGLKCCSVTDIDLIVSNVILHDDCYSIIDYEWTFDFLIPVNFVIYRSITYLFKGPRNTFVHNSFYQTKLFDQFGIDDDQCRIYAEMEKNFQNYTSFNRTPLRKVCVASLIRSDILDSEVFFDYGSGFSARNRYKVSPKVYDKDCFEITIGVTDGIKAIRLDPTDQPCIVAVKEIKALGCLDENNISYKTNGLSVSHSVYLFASNDPQIIVSNIGYGTQKISIKLELSELSHQMAQGLSEHKMGGAIC